MRTPYKNLIPLSLFFLISLLLLIGLPKGAPEPQVSADQYFLDEKPYCGPNDDVKHTDNIVVEALLREITDDFGQNWLTLDLYLVGLLEEPLTFQRSLGDQNSLEARTEVISYLNNTWSSSQISVVFVEDQQTLSALPPQEQPRLTHQPEWPGYVNGAPARKSDLACPPEKTDDIRALEKALEKCGKSPPEVSCDCEEGETACAYFDRRVSPPKIFLCPKRCVATTQRLQSSWVHELIHALQFGCRNRPDRHSCQGSVQLEYLAYLCAGQCQNVIDCCWAAAHSSAGVCWSFLLAFRECFDFFQADSDWVEQAPSCCPNPGAPDSYGACKDIRSVNPETGEASEGSDGICDVYQGCFPLTTGGFQDRNKNGICDNFGVSKECCDDNSDGIGDCWQPIIPEPGGIIPDILPPSCDEDFPLMQGECNPDDPAERRVKCRDNGSNIDIITQVCCRDNNLCPDGPCWARASECVVKAWCF